jgi:hypothetical protein
MNMSNEERFHELAHKALARAAEPTEQAELQALIAENPQLKEEIEQMDAETSVARELLPLIEDLQDPRRDMPQPPMRRLQRAIQEVFGPRAESPGELRELLARLENWAERQIGHERHRLVELISDFRSSLSAPRGEHVIGLRVVQACAAPKASRLREEAEVLAMGEGEEERKKREAQFEARLRSLEARIRQAEQITHECREEMQGLIEAFASDREARAERKQARSNQPSKPHD